VMLLLSLFAEALINSKALVVRYQGEYYFPIVSDVYSGKTFGLESSGEANYRLLQLALKDKNNGDFAILPLVPWNPYEQDFSGEYLP
ncbi:ABC transporter permease, partial [Vibrio breoganii]